MCLRCRNTKWLRLFFSCVCLLFLSLSFGVFARICVTDCIFFSFSFFQLFFITLKRQVVYSTMVSSPLKRLQFDISEYVFFQAAIGFSLRSCTLSFRAFAVFLHVFPFMLSPPFPLLNENYLEKKSYHFIGEKNIGRVGGALPNKWGPPFLLPVDGTVPEISSSFTIHVVLGHFLFYFIEKKTGNSRFSVANAPFFVFVSFGGFVQQKNRVAQKRREQQGSKKR